MRDFDEYITSLADLDRREIIRQLVFADADAHRLATSGHRERRGTSTECHGEQARYERIIYFLRFREPPQGLTDADLKLCGLLASKLNKKGQGRA
jgi:hypothetical protein